MREIMRRRVLIVKNWLFEPYGTCSLLVLTLRHKLERLWIVLHVKPIRRHFALGFPRARLSLSQEKSSGVEIGVVNRPYSRWPPCWICYYLHTSEGANNTSSRGCNKHLSLTDDCFHVY